MKRVEFNMKQNMSAKEMLNEIEGKVSGETIQQMEELKTALGDVENEPKLEIFLDPYREYAMIRLETDIPDCCNFTMKAYRYFLSGITDEGFYFFHELDGGAVRNFKTMESLVDWINRADEGFCERVQGDILIQYIKPEYEIKGERVAKKEFWDYITKTKEDHYSRSCSLKLDFINDNYIRMRGSDMEVPERTIDIGNHRVVANWAYASWNRGVNNIVVFDDAFKLQHPQHGITSVETPKGHVAILAPQRGRAGVQAID